LPTHLIFGFVALFICFKPHYFFLSILVACF
jgi:hypothetical protein